jgi:hypothetical protein
MRLFGSVDSRLFSLARECGGVLCKSRSSEVWILLWSISKKGRCK